MLTKEQIKQLIQTAMKVREFAYAPYSNYAVGAALMGENGEIFSGVNVENAAYPSSMCAERVALFKAVSKGNRKFEAIAVVTANGGLPCGACRQVLSEFGMDIVVIIADETGELKAQTTVRDLLPGAFSAADLTD